MIKRDTLASGSEIYDDVVRVASSLAASADAPPGFVPNLADVARLANVAPITVSRALRNPAKVSEEKRQRIMRAVEETGYRANPFASALKSGRTNIVLALASNMFSEQFAQALRAAAEVLEAAGYIFLIGQTSYSYKKETAVIGSLKALRPAAVMFTGVIELEENRKALAELGIPILETWAMPRDPLDMLVGFSNVEAGRFAARELARTGRRKLAYCGRRGGRGALRLKGFEDYCREAGLEFAGAYLRDDVTGPSDGRKCLQALLQSGKKFDALFCGNDLLALGSLIEARRSGIAVPDELAIIGFGESDMAGEVQPGLTTIGIDSAKLGQAAGELLVRRLGGEILAEKSHRVPLVITRRGSCERVAAASP